uniref:NADH dehydrogenase subunit 6 n=1 Tax=Anchon yunnanense TaxID=2885775 RepID=UPI001EDCAFE1|nr:NADH dehydrogenase subunit 6 [Anchon yunnanense]UKB86906.1 NADH dehydrogenase subunit 6 [Anchon yunnanense]
MKTTLMKLMMTTSIMSTMMKMPMSMGITLMIQTMMAISLMNTMSTSSWIPSITFLIMIGGLMIIFMYMSSITSNEKFKLNLKMLYPMTIMMLMMEEMMSNYQTPEIQNLQKESPVMMSMTKMYSKSMMMTMLIMMFLLLTMIVVNKITKMFEGPLRTKTYE